MKIKILLLSVLSLGILHTLNAQWSVKYLDESLFEHKGAIRFVNDSVGLHMGSSALVLKSIDAGETWRKIHPGIEADYIDFQVINDSIVYAITSDKLIRSIDVAENWEVVANFEADNLYSLFMLDRDSGIIANSDKLYRTVDEGENWYKVCDLKDLGYKYGGVYHLFFPTKQIGFAIGLGRTEYDPENLFHDFILKTYDSGITWDTIKTFSKIEFFYVHFVNESVGFIGGGSSIYKTNDGGYSWDQVMSTDSYQKVLSIHFVSDSIGYATGSDDLVWILDESYPPQYYFSFFIAKTIDAGDNWEVYDTVGIRLNSIYFLNDSVGFVTGDFGLIMKTSGNINQLSENYPWHLVIGYNSIKEIQLQQSSEIYPNPTSGLFTLRITNSLQPVESVKMFEISGRCIDIINPRPFEQNIQLDLSGRFPGLYLVQVIFPKKTELLKVIKK